MYRLWEQYLNQILPVEGINNLVIYTDLTRYWLMEGLLDYAEHQNWTSSLQVIEEITDEEAMEIRQSLAGLLDQTLLLAFFSDKNPVLDELQPIFPLLQSPVGYTGYSIIGHQYLPNQYFIDHLTTDYYSSEELGERYYKAYGTKFDLNTDDLFIEAKIKSKAIFPFSSNVSGQRNLIFPSTEIVFELELQSVEVTLSRVSSIGTVVDRGELIDPFGFIHDELTILVEGGQITDIQGNKILVDRLKRCISIPSTFDQVQLSIGLGNHRAITGFVEQDRLLRNNVTVSWYDTERDLYLEMIVGNIE